MRQWSLFWIKKRYVSSIFKKIIPKTSGTHRVFNKITALFSLTNKQTNKHVYQFTCTDYKAQNNSVGSQVTGHRSQVTPELWVLRMELALCHPSDTKSFDVAHRFFEKKIRVLNNGTLIWMLQIFTYSAEQGITKSGSPRVNILSTNAIRQETCL